MDKYLRNWRQDALNKGQHDAAIFIGDKVLALTNNDSDAFWLAQVHFSNNNYTRALALLSRKDLIHRSLSCRYLAAHCYVKQGKYEQALSILGEDNPLHLMASAQHNARRKLAHINGSGRNVTHRAGKAQRDRIEYSEERERDRESEKELKFQAGMCYLRGLCFAKRNAFEKAKECYEAAVRIDVQCFEAFDQLMRNSLMSPAEEMAFLEELDFDTIRVDDPSMAQEAAHFTKLLYTMRLSKYSSPASLANATETLSTHYNLAANPDLLLTRAEVLYTQCRFHEALVITTNILNSSLDSDSLLDDKSADTQASLGHNPNLYPVHLASLFETGAHTTLFHLAHTLSVNAPHEAYTYLAIGTYYLSTGRIAEARRFFSKASLMDPHSAPAWIGFAHTFAAEGEHDQAIAAYSTASRLFQGSHLPNLFLGMQHLALNNMQLAWEYCTAAFAMSSGSVKKSKGTGNTNSNEEADSTASLIFHSPHTLTGDPLVVNELGIILYHQSNLSVAAHLFKRALELAAGLGSNMTAWIATRANLAHALRRMGKYEEALSEFDECLRTATGNSSISNLHLLEDRERVILDPNGNNANANANANANTAGGVVKSLASLNLSGSMMMNGHPSHGSASGYEERNLIGSIHTSRGLVLMSMMNRTQEAVMALHEAVRVLGGDTGGGGAAGSLLSKAMEIWAAECENTDDEDDENENDDAMDSDVTHEDSELGHDEDGEEYDDETEDDHGDGGIIQALPSARLKPQPHSHPYNHTKGRGKSRSRHNEDDDDDDDQYHYPDSNSYSYSNPNSYSHSHSHSQQRQDTRHPAPPSAEGEGSAVIYRHQPPNHRYHSREPGGDNMTTTATTVPTGGAIPTAPTATGRRRRDKERDVISRRLDGHADEMLGAALSGLS